MVVEHIQSIFSAEHGGPMNSLRNFVYGQAAQGLTVRVRVLEGFAHTSPALRLDQRVDQRIFAVRFPRVSGRSPELRRFLRSSDSPDVYHLHGVWTLGQKYGMHEALRRRVPYVVEMMGGYQPEELRRKPWRKRLFRRWFQDELLRRASCIHTNSEMEARQLMQLGFRGPFAPIPVGFDIAAADAAEASIAGYRPSFAAQWDAEDRVTLFLARIHRNKGIELLLDAHAQLAGEFPGFRLAIVGPGLPAYVAELKQRVSTRPGAERIQFIGYVDERDKTWLYKKCFLYCLPSYSENFGATIQDALGYGTPVLTTTRTPWDRLESMQAGWVVEPDVKSIRDGLARALQTPKPELTSMGSRGRAWIRREFSLEKVIRSQISMYDWVSGGVRPPFILSAS